jgi:hypothetical protein
MLVDPQRTEYSTEARISSNGTIEQWNYETSGWWFSRTVVDGFVAGPYK